MKKFLFSFVFMGLFTLPESSQAAFGECVGENCYKDVSISRTFGGTTRTRTRADSSGNESTGRTISTPQSKPSETFRDGSVFPSNTCDIKSSTVLEDTATCEARTGCNKCEEPKAAPCEKASCREVPPAPKPCRPCPPKTYEFSCNDFASVDLQQVDFRMRRGGRYEGFSDRLGQFRFRIFGCRRETRNILLNQGRTIEKDMRFFDIFEEVTGGCLNNVRAPQNICVDSDKPLPEYVLTAEITDYFMNVCDEHNWLKGKKKDLRKGSAEMTVTWRLMNLTRTETLWKGSSTGYAEVEEGDFKGDLRLVENAFADAVGNLRMQPGFEQRLAMRASPNELEKQRSDLLTFQQRVTPAKCDYEEEIKDALETQASFMLGDDDTIIRVSLEDDDTPRVIDFSNPEECEDMMKDVMKDVLENAGLNSFEVFENGGLSKEEFREFLGNSGITEEEFVETVGVAEITEDSGVSLIEFREFLERGGIKTFVNSEETSTKVVSTEKVKEVLEGAGLNSVEIIETGSLSKEEFKEFLETSGITKEEFIETVGVAEITEDSGVSLEEFREFLERGGVKTFVTAEESSAKPLSSGKMEMFGSASSGTKQTLFQDPEIIRLVEECSISTAPEGIFESSGISSNISEIFERSGINSYVSSEEVDTRTVPGITVETSCYRTEDGRILHEAAAADIISAGGAVTKVTCLVEDVEHTEDYWLDIASNEESAALSGSSQLCIKDRKPFDTLNEEAISEIRVSLVSIQNARNQRGAGLLVSESIVLTSADLIVKDKNVYDVILGSGKSLKAKAFRINPNKNIALLTLDKEITYHPLALSTDLPDIGAEKFTSLGLLDVEPGKEDFISETGNIEGYRYSENLGTEIVVGTFVQNMTIGGVLFDNKGTIYGISHMGKRLEDGPDIFIPIDVAIKSVGLDICGREVVIKKKPEKKPAKPISKLIEKSKAPKVMKKKLRK